MSPTVKSVGTSVSGFVVDTDGPNLAFGVATVAGGLAALVVRAGAAAGCSRRPRQISTNTPDGYPDLPA